MWLGSGVAVAVVEAGGYSYNWTPNLGASICCGCGPGKDKKTKKKKLYEQVTIFIHNEKILEVTFQQAINCPLHHNRI